MCSGFERYLIPIAPIDGPQSCHDSMSSEIGTCGDCSPSCQGREVRQVCGHDSVCSCLFSPTLLAFYILAPSLSLVSKVFEAFSCPGEGPGISDRTMFWRLEAVMTRTRTSLINSAGNCSLVFPCSLRKFDIPQTRVVLVRTE